MGESKRETVEKVYTRNTGTEGAREKRRRLDLNAAQVAGSAVAAVVAAKLAAKMGVYGTVLGAGVISVIATCGGSVLQHMFRSTGERVREVAVPVGRTRRGRRAEERPGLRREFGEATVYGTRVRGRKRSAIAAALVFVLAMAGITAYELMSGQDFSGGRGTTISGVVRGGDSGHRPATTPSPTHPEQRRGQSPDGSPEQHGDDHDPSRQPTPRPGGQDSGGDGDTGSATPAPDPADPTDPTPAPPPDPTAPAPTPTPTPPAAAPSADGPTG
ncbi:hypothetical protein [Streptomyces lavendofoliae]|nr:hypothetical protein [Streptomyces lavendofoliae]